MADEVRRTPDKLAGAENLSRALANVMDFALQRQFQKEQQMQAFNAVKAKQDAEENLLDRKIQADFSNLQTKMAQDALFFKEEQETKRKELDLLNKAREKDADIAQLKRLRELDKAESDLRVRNIQNKYENSKEVRDANIIAQAKILYPSHEVLDAYERIASTGYGEQEVLDNMLKQYDTLERLKKAYLVSEGITIPQEYGPFRDEYRFGTPGISKEVQPQQSPFDFMGEGGRELVEPQVETPQKSKFEWAE